MSEDLREGDVLARKSHGTGASMTVGTEEQIQRQAARRAPCLGLERPPVYSSFQLALDSQGSIDEITMGAAKAHGHCSAGYYQNRIANEKSPLVMLKPSAW